ncbi:YdcF family protein [Pyruvatibacter sp.]|uniref:YdcF family protein n=1 Tax=Pyruvatibacter sp. TaxID=1981328 RepID=UPI0032EACC2F
MNDPIPIFEHSSAPDRRRFRLLRCLMVILATAFLLLAGGFLQFVSAVSQSTHAIQTATPADAIVVLTGARDRISKAMALLEQGKGDRLLISGVNRDVSRADLESTIGGPDTKFDCCVDLGFEARTTDGNANETASWVRKNGYKSLIVVTSDYHMPRSLAVLGHEMPGVVLIPHAVASDGPSASRALGSFTIARLLVSEYAKYVVTLLRTRLG